MKLHLLPIATRRQCLLAALAGLMAFAATLVPVVSSPPAQAEIAASADLLASWNDGAAKQAILDFVHATTDPSSPNFVPPEDRIATFDKTAPYGSSIRFMRKPCSRSTACARSRLHIQIGRTRAVPGHISNDQEAIAKFTEQDWTDIIGVTHSGMSNEEFIAIAKQWLETAAAPAFPSALHRTRLSADAGGHAISALRSDSKPIS